MLLYVLLLWNLISPAMRMRSFQSGAKEGLFSLGGVLLTFSFLTSLLTHVVIVVALGYYSVYLTTVPILVASSILFLAKSCVDKEFRKWRLGPKLTHCLISAIFPITTPRSKARESEESKELNNHKDSADVVTAKVKIARNELFFCYLLHFFVLILGMIAFAVLNLEPQYAEKMLKLKQASTISMEATVYMACPLALLLSGLSQLVYRKCCDPWKAVKSKIEVGSQGFCGDWKLLPKSKIVHQEIELQGAKDRRRPPRKDPVEEVGRLQEKKVSGKETVGAELEEIFGYIRNNRTDPTSKRNNQSEPWKEVRIETGCSCPGPSSGPCSGSCTGTCSGPRSGQCSGPGRKPIVPGNKYVPRAVQLPQETLEG